MIIDVSSACAERARALASAGVQTIIRYYSRDTGRPSKRLSYQEAQAHAAAGLSLAIVHEARHGNQASSFDRSTGIADATYSRSYGDEEIRQPHGSAIYFAVDFDASASEIRDRIIPYFEGVAEALADNPACEVGVYGSGASCKAVLDAGLAKFAWLAQATRWQGYRAFERSGRWALKQNMPSSIAGVSCDTNELGAGGVFGDFSQSAMESEMERPVQVSMRVNARSGLRLRSGPGTEFDSLKLLPLNTLVYPIRIVGSWTVIDLEGDGHADGFVSSGYLIDAGSAGTEMAAAGILDAQQIEELIYIGSTPGGLKEAREIAARSLPGYPTNGCAAHLSALLQLAGIAVPMTWGAGKFAHLIERRGWRRISVGDQAAGDVGVCFDNDPTPAGADHIYLVVETRGRDEMLIADNQRDTDGPHSRYASGRGGKTPTEYFLRAA